MTRSFKLINDLSTFKWPLVFSERRKVRLPDPALFDVKDLKRNWVFKIYQHSLVNVTEEPT